MMLPSTSMFTIISLTLVALYNFHTLLTASPCERLLMKKELRILRDSIYFALWIIYTITLTSFPVNSEPPGFQLLFVSPNIFFTMTIFLMILILLILISWKNYDSTRKWIISYLKWLVKKNHNFIFYSIFIFSSISILYYFVILTYIYGSIINLLFSAVNNVFKLNFKTTTDAIPYVLDNLTSKEPLLILFIILSITLLYRLFLQPLVSLYSIFLKKEIKVKIKLSNNETIHNAYLLYPTFGNRLLLGNKPLSSSSDHKFAISRDKIEYIEFFIRDVFSRDTHYNKDQISFGKKDTPKVFISNHKNYRKIKRKR